MSNVTRKSQIKRTMRYHYVSIRTTKIQNTGQHEMLDVDQPLLVGVYIHFGGQFDSSLQNYATH